jgi:starch synthase
MLKVLFAAAEAVPFVKTGGLADVIGSLPKYLKQQGIDVRVVMPKYSDIPQNFHESMTFKRDITVPLAWRQQYCGIFELNHEGVPFYFIDNEYYFKRSGLYGHFDDAERFAYFARSVLEILPHIDFKPDVIHCHDWHAGMTAVFFDAFYKNRPEYQGIKHLFTIHNLKYQGVFDKVILEDILGLGWEYFSDDKLEFHDAVNFMKAGIVYSHQVSTVSRTYAHEIQYPYFGEGLDGLLRARQSALTGIVNGIDYDVYNPETDPNIFVNYSSNSVEGKKENKAKLQERLGLPVRRETPMIAIVSRLVDPKGLDLVARILEELIIHEDVQLVVLGTGEEKYENMFKSAAWRHPAKVSANIYFDDFLAHQIYAAADLFLMPSRFEPCGIGQLIALRYGTLPIVRETGGLKDTVVPYNKYTGAGNGFSFTNYNAHDMFFTIKRALGMFGDKPVWNKIVQNAMNDDYSWNRSAGEYIGLYNRLAGI